MTRVTVGIDIGGTTTDFAFVDRDGACLAGGSMRTDAHADIEPYLGELVGSIERCKSDSSLSLELIGCGIGAPNANYFTGTVDHAPNLSWKGVVPLAALLSEQLAVPAVLTNDANAAALGEMLFGSAKGLTDFVLVTLGTGLGSGFVTGGELLYGHDGFAGELGHTIVIPEGRECGCGRRGCLETYVSVSGLMRTVRQLLEDGQASSLADQDPTSLKGEDVFTAAQSGDVLALNAFERTGRLLGLALANTVAITSPSDIILFGGLVGSGDLLLKPTQAAFEENLLNIYRGNVNLSLSGLRGSEAAVQGAAALSWKELEQHHDGH